MTASSTSSVLPQSRAVASAARISAAPEALAAGAAVDQHLREVGAVGLVLGLIEDQLHGAADAVRVLGDQQRALARAPRPGDPRQNAIAPARASAAA